MAVIPTALGIRWSCHLPRTTLHIVVLSGALQVFGIATTIYGLYGDTRAFGSSLAEPFANWWRRRPWGVRQGHMGASMPGFNARAIGTVKFQRQPMTDLPGRVSEIERHLDYVQQIHGEMGVTIANLSFELRDALEKEQGERKAEVLKVLSQLKDHAVGSVHVSMLGIYWVLLGTLLSTLKDVLAAAH